MHQGGCCSSTCQLFVCSDCVFSSMPRSWATVQTLSSDAVMWSTLPGHACCSQFVKPNGRNFTCELQDAAMPLASGAPAVLCVSQRAG